MPGGPLLARRPPAETTASLGSLIEATPDQAQLYALRAREAERALDFEAAEQDWKEFASRVADPAAGQLSLADFYERRLRPVDEVEALLAVGRSPSPASERFTEPEQQRSWQAFERVIEVSHKHLLPDRIALEAYRSWLARYSDQQAVYRRYLDFLVAHEMFAAGESLLADYTAAFPADSTFPVGAHAQLASASNGPDAALLLLESSFEPLWPLELFETYFHSLEEADRLRERLDQAQQRVASAPDDLASVSWVFHYRRRQGDREGAIVALQEFIENKERRAAEWSAIDLRTAAELFLRVNDYVDAARCRYALYNLPGASADDREYALGGLIEIILDAPEQPIAAASGDFSYYRDIATADSGPGALNGVLSLLLNSQGLEWSWPAKQRAAGPYLRRARALELLERFEAEFPQSEQRSALDAKAVRAFGVYGDDQAVIDRGQRFLSQFADAGERSEIQFLVAEAHARRGETAEEFAAYESMLRELSARFEQVPLGPNVVADPSQRYYGNVGAPRSPDYARVLDRYVSRLVGLQRLPDAVRVYVLQLAENPDDPGLYERMAAFLEANRLTAQVEGVYQQAIAQFGDASWSHKLGRWYLRQQRQGEFEQLTREVVDSFAGTELEGYFNQVAAGPGMTDQLYLRLNQYAYERFPHNLTFVRNLLNAYRRQSTRNEAAARDLLRRHWFYADDLRRQYFAALTQSGQLDATIAEAVARAGVDWTAAAASNPAGTQLVAEGAIWKADFEQAAAPALALAALSPSDEPVTSRATALHRSLAAFDPANTDRAITLSDGRIEADPGNRTLLAEAGDILADRGLMVQASPYWDRITQTAPGDAQSYLASATVYWDYYLFDQAVAQLNEGRRQLGKRSLYSFEAGAIEEGRNDPDAAIREYLQGALDQPPDEQSRQRLVTLARRADYRDQIDQATAQLTSSESPSRQAIDLRIAVLEGLDRRDELETLLVAVAERTESRGLLEQVEQVAQSRGIDAAQTAALLKRIDITRDPVELRRLRIRLAQLYESFGNASAAERVSSQLYAEEGHIVGVVRERVDFLWRNDNRAAAIDVLLESAAAAYPALADQLRFEAARKATDAQSYGRAETILDALLTAHPFDAGYTAAMADLFARQGRDDALAAFYERQIEAAGNAGLAPDAQRSTVGTLRQGIIPALNRLERYTEAVDQYIELINRFPDDEALTKEAAFYAADHSLGDRLADYYVHTTEQSPRDVRYHRVLARIETHLERFPEAIDAYGRALAVTPNDVALWRERTELQERLLRLEDALAGYRKLHALSYQDPQWMLAAARVHARRGETAEAVAAVRAALIDDRPERANAYFSAAESLEQWGMVEEALTLASRGVELAGDRLLTEESNGAQLYVKLAARLRRHPEAVDRLVAAEPSPTYDGWEYGLAPAFENLTRTAAEYFTPEEEQQFIGYLASLRTRLDASIYEHALLPAVRASGPAELEARWLAADLVADPAGGDYSQKRARLIELQQKRMQYAELGRQLEDHWRAYPMRNRVPFLLNESAKAYRVAGEVANEFRVLEFQSLANSWQERYAALLLERNPTELLNLARRPLDSFADRTAEYVILRGDSDLAWRALEARGQGRPAVWERVYKGLTGVFHADAEARYRDAYISALGDAAIGDRIGQPVDRDLQLAGDLWFYHAARYGERQAAIGAANPEYYLPAQTEARPASASAQFELGELYNQYASPQRAEAAYRLAVELNPDAPLYRVRLGESALDAGDRAAAVEHWKQALEGYAAQVRASQLGAQFWDEVADLFGKMGAQSMLPDLRTEGDSLLSLYLTRSGLFRFDQLARASLGAGYSTAELFALAPNAADQVSFFSVLADAEWLSAGDREEAFTRAIASAAEQLTSAPRPQAPYRRQALNELRYRLIEFRLANGRTAEAQSLVADSGEDFVEALTAQRPALYIQLQAVSGAVGDLFAANAAPLPEFAVQEAVVALRGSGSDAAANSVLRLFYEKMIAQRAYSLGYFLGLAELYLEQGASGQAEALLRRMTALSPEPYGAHLDASALLEKAGQTASALGFASEKMRAEPWSKESQLAVARLEGSSAALASIAGDDRTPYDLRAQAAQQLAASGGSNQSFGSDELDLLARGAAAPTANPTQPGFYRARIAAAATAPLSSQVTLLTEALALRPEAAGDVRERLFEAARAAGNHYRAVAALEPLLTNGTSLEFDSAFTENASQTTFQPWMVDSFLAALSLPANQRAEIATNLAESLRATDRRQAAQSMLDIAIALEDTPARQEARQTVVEEAARQVENARRRPRVGDHLDQPEVVRPMLAAGGAQ